MTVATYFFIAFGLSALGSLPIGMITLKVTEKTIHNGYRSGVMVSLGATVIEFLYTFIALMSIDFFVQNVSVNVYINLLAMIVFFVLGVYHFSKKTKLILESEGEYKTFDFIKGILLASMNMLIIPFWIFLALWLKNQGFEFSSMSLIFVFSTGSALGALLVFLLYIWLGRFIVNKIRTVSFYTNKAVGLVFLILGIYQLIQLF